MNKLWSDRAWDDYLYWQMQDKKTLKKINELVKDIERNGLAEGIGKPEPLKHRKAWSRRIDRENRLVYNIDDQKNLWIIACKGHYDDTGKNIAPSRTYLVGKRCFLYSLRCIFLQRRPHGTRSGRQFREHALDLLTEPRVIQIDRKDRLI